MADAETARLCVQIITSHFGPLTASVASVLLTRGRLPIGQIIRFTALKPRTVRASILALVQHNIVWHAQTEEDGQVLEVNVDECLIRLRFGRYVWQAKQLFGQNAADIVQIILDHGKLRSSQILSHLGIYDSKQTTVYNQALYNLVKKGYLKPSTVLSHVSPRDKRIRYEAEEKAKIVGFPTAKEVRQAKEDAAIRLKREEEEAEKVGLKRQVKQASSSKSSKRKAVAEEDVIDDEVYFRVNAERFHIHIRNKLIESAARGRFNETAGLVIRAILKATEATQLSISDVRSDPTSISNVSLQIPDGVELSDGLILPSKKTPNNISCIKDYIGILSSADNPTPEGRDASFVSFQSSKIQVEFEIVGRRLRQRILEAVTRERHGDRGVRVLRLLLDVGKMDEKQVSKVAMMSAQEVRPLLAAMSSDSLISTQEVPKSADRNPTRTFYLWHVDLHKTYSVLLGNLHKTLHNISIRRQAERDEPVVKAVLEKRQRSDVALDEDLLNRMEKDVLKEWESKQERLTVLEMRVEEAVFILRDLGVFGTASDDA